MVRALLQQRKQNLTQSSTFTKVVYLLRQLSILSWGTRVTFKVGIFNKHFLAEALALSSQHKTKHNAFALPALQRSAGGTCESHPDRRSFTSLLGRERWVPRPRQSALMSLGTHSYGST